MRDYLGAHPDALDDDPATCADAVAAATVRKAMKGVIYATEVLRDTTEGRPGVKGIGGGLGLVATILSLPPRDAPAEELPELLGLSRDALRAKLLEGASFPEPEPLPLPAAREAEVPAPAGEGDEGPEDEPEGGAE